MAASRQNNSRGGRCGIASALRRFAGQAHARERERGQALIEFSFVAVIMVVMALGVIDFGRALYVQQVLTHLSREGSNLASRNTTLTDTVNAVAADSSPLNIDSNGYVIVTSIKNNGGTLQLLEQQTRGGKPTGSRIYNSSSKKFTLPPAIPAVGQTVYVTEVSYQFSPVTPIGSMLGLVLPSNMYDVAYF